MERESKRLSANLPVFLTPWPRLAPGRQRSYQNNPPSLDDVLRKMLRTPPLAPVNAPTWLVVRRATGLVLESTELGPGTDLGSVLID